MSTALAVVKLNKKSMIPADAVENTFVFTFGDTPPTGADFAARASDLVAFYNANHTPEFAISDFLSESLSTGAEANEIAWYLLDGHLDGTPHGAPVRLDLWTLGSTGSGSLPDEVAAVLTYQRAYGGDVEFGVGTRPRARDRGRLYLGPWAPAAVGIDSVTKEPFLNPAVGRAMEQAGIHLKSDSANTWVQWSRANGNVAEVIGGWVDDAFDSQRRRGNKATARILW